MSGRLVRRVGLWLVAVLGVAVPAALALAWTLWPRTVEPNLPFEPHPISLRGYNWFDVGVVDANGDRNLDIFTSNHNGRQSLLLGDGRGGFADALSEWGLDQDADFPGLEDADVPPAFERSGLYVYWHNRALHLYHHAGTDQARVSGSLELASDVSARHAEGFEVEIAKEAIQPDGTKSVVAFAASDPGRLVLDPSFRSVPIALELEPEVSLDRVYIGSARMRPRTHAFELYLRDRHGMAWTDYNDDGVLDVFITRGGLYGEMARFPERFSDEVLLSQGPGRYRDRGAQLGLAKNGCPGRQAAWVDFNGDGRLDLYLACGRPGGAHPNQLYQQLADGRLIEVAEQAGLDFADDGTFLWFDVEADGDADLLWASSTGLWLYRDEGGRFAREALQPTPMTQVQKLALADFDADGDLDVFAAAALGSKLLVNRDGALEPADPGELGLPSRCKTANWVDFDNDGLVDLHVWPGGLYRQSPSGRFAPTELIAVSSPYWWLLEPRVIWFDLDNDGDRDVLVLQRYFPRLLQEAYPSALPFTASLMRNVGQSRNHWLQVELVGPTGNRQAIGARVSVATPDRVQLRQVGQAEGSHHSQGHYRTYFGLGRHPAPVDVSVHWPDGRTQEIRGVAGDRLLVVEHPDARALQPSRGAASMLRSGRHQIRPRARPPRVIGLERSPAP